MFIGTFDIALVQEIHRMLKTQKMCFSWSQNFLQAPSASVESDILHGTAFQGEE